MAVQQFCLRWNNHQPNFVSVFASLLNSESLVDVTLAAEGKHVQAHKVVLSACSSYFQNLFAINPCQHPIVILKDVKYKDLRTVVDFMYYGEVNVTQEQLTNVLKTAEMLKIKGLAEVPEESLPGMKTKLSERQGSSMESSHDSVTHQMSWGSARSDTAGHESGMEGRRSPSPCGSPSSRKRIRKSSTGSRSSSTERNNNETSCEMQENSTLIIKAEPISSSHESAEITVQERSISSENRDGSLESIEEDKGTPNVSVEGTTIKEINTGPSATTTPTPAPVASMRTKRGRPLVRQTRIKKECELLAPPLIMTSSMETSMESLAPSSSSSPPPSCSSSSTFLLAAPSHHKMERHHSEPPMSTSSRRSPTPPPPPLLPLASSVCTTVTTSTVKSPSPSYLVVPAHAQQATLQKQRSQPLPSSAVTTTTLVQRQHSQPSLPHIQLAQTQPTFHLTHGMSKLPLQVRVVPTGSEASPLRETSPSIVIEQFPLVRVVSADTPLSTSPLTPTTITSSSPSIATTKPLAIRPKSEDNTSSPAMVVTTVTSIPVGSPAPAAPPLAPLQHQRSSDSSSSSELQRSGHCPVLRQGPALGCNFCWNSIDDHGRILRRKTKYCCPECKTNLCIVPCFQQYHHKFEGEVSAGKPSSVAAVGAAAEEEARARTLPKTGSV